MEDLRHEILRINKKFTDDICELNKKYDYWLNNKNFVLYSISTVNFLLILKIS